MDYSSPVSPIPATGDRYALPADFVNGLAFLRPLLPKKGRSFETDVNLIGGKLYLLTTKLIVEYDAGAMVLWPSRDSDSRSVQGIACRGFHR
jgi:hypothetical protein